jgi:hypothetical protein
MRFLILIGQFVGVGAAHQEGTGGDFDHFGDRDCGPGCLRRRAGLCVGCRRISAGCGADVRCGDHHNAGIRRRAKERHRRGGRFHRLLRQRLQNLRLGDHRIVTRKEEILEFI